MKDAVVNKDNSVYANTAEASNTAERLDFSREEMIDHTLSDLSLGQEINIKFYKNGCRARHVLGFKTVVSSYRSNNTHSKYSKWKEKALKNAQKPV